MGRGYGNQEAQFLVQTKNTNARNLKPLLKTTAFPQRCFTDNNEAVSTQCLTSVHILLIRPFDFKQLTLRK